MSCMISSTGRNNNAVCPIFVEDDMKNEMARRDGVSVILSFLIVIFLGASSAETASGASSTPWLWRQPPYQIVFPYAIPSVQMVAWGGADNNIIYAGSSFSNESTIPYGIYRSADYGLTWDYLGEVDENENEFLSKIVVHPTSPNVVFAGFSIASYEGGIYRSEDGGDSWVNVLPYVSITDVTVDPSNTATMYATGLGSATHMTPSTAGVYKSTDMGQTWTQISTSYFNDIKVHPTSPNILFSARYFSTNSYEGIYRSDDSGQTWKQISDIQLSHIVINKNNPDQMFIFGESYIGIWRTDDGGNNWINVNSNLPTDVNVPSVLSAIFDPMQSNTLWIGLKYEGMYVSYNGGEVWQQVSDGLPFSDTGIFGPQCGSSDISGGQMVISCSDRLFVRLMAQSNPPVTNCEAVLSADLNLHIPIVSFNGKSYLADLQYDQTTGNIKLIGANVISDTSPFADCATASLSLDLELSIPVVLYNGVSYWADLQGSGSDIFLTGFGQN